MIVPLCLCWLVVLCPVLVSSFDNVTISQELANFLGTLERYTDTPNDVIFLLDESGSITEAKYPEVKTFTELTVRHLAVSADKSRVAIISFSDYPRTLVNYIKYSSGNNMCTLIKRIHALDYIGQGTATRLAMEESRKLFSQARHNSQKIIVLITDGQSNAGYSPVDEAIRFKREGVIIFAVGVADVNVAEIEAVASSRDHIYILKKFDHIVDVNKYLVKAIKETSWDYVEDTSLCNNFCNKGTDCCDEHAKCFCGTTGGSYECNCDVGYFGTGHKHDCHECLKGTYKTEVGNKDCIPCPEHSTTKDKGSTKASDCVCDNGYVWHGNHCKAIECAKLVAPPGGILIPTECNNLYGTECKVKCKEGYCPYSCSFPNEDIQILPWNQLPLQSRTCLDTGIWTGNDFKCEKMKCPELEHPFFGKHNCSGSDFSFGTTCNFECDLGYELRGSSIRECLFDGSWTGTQAKCSVKYCDPLKSNQNLRVKPNKCSASKMPFGSVCIYHCSKGYTLTSQNGKSDGINECLANATWSGASNQISCEDTSPPSIECPKPIVTQTDPSKSTASVIWDLPKAKDNIFVNSLHIKEPKFIRKPPYSFPIGSTKIVYEAVDSVDLSNTCSFNVTVLDKEPPSVLFCPPDIELFSENNAPVPVTWNEPKFQDNSGKYSLSPPNKKSGDGFSWGSRDVIFYNVTDPSGNKAFCNFTVTVKPYQCPYFEPPENGIVTCDMWQQGRLCSVFCNEGYAFVSKKKVPTIFECFQTGSSVKKEGTWIPFVLLPEFAGFQLPVPDCSRIQKRSALNVSVQLNYTVDECSDDAVNKMKEKFLGNLKPFDAMFPEFICPVIDGINSCSPENVRVECLSSKSKKKRSVRPRRKSGSTLMVSFNFELQPTTNEDNANDIADDPTISIAKEIETLTSENVREVYNLTSIPEPQLSYNIVVICSAGQLRINNTCVNCPTGTFKEDFSGICADCPSSTYQDKENSLSCLPCPVGYTTYQKRSKHLSDCKAPCQPGTYSRTSFEPCFPCPLHTFQDRPRSQECTKCPKGLQTWKTGANSSSDCTTPCNPGTFSDTGFEPCILCDFGFYQDKSQQKMCEICPNSTSTREKGSNTVNQCKDINVCEEINPCANGSTCIPTGNEYICICTQDFFGKHCEETSNYCDTDFCLNNGTCVKKNNQFECICSDGFSGLRCETNINDCKKGLCRNGGKCVDLINAYECVCSAGYTGSNCEINIFDCASDPCLNGGTCFDKLNDYKCCCRPGYTGPNCETEIKPPHPCDAIHCQNEGICISNENNSTNNPTCVCKPGFVGPFCEINFDDCFNHTCYNDGICIDGIGNATCQCSQMYDGAQCEKALLPEYSLSFTSQTTADYAKIENKERLPAMTVSLFMRTTYKVPQTRPTAFSYSSYDSKGKVVIDNALTLFDTNRLIIYIHNKALHTGFEANKDNNWHHYAIVWEKQDGRWAFYVDGEVIVEGIDVGKDEYIWPGVFVLGQEQDSLGGTFSTPEAFVGDITEFNVWDYVLSKDEIKRMSSSCGFIGNVISWFQLSSHLHGNIVVSEEVDLCKGFGTCSDGYCPCLYFTGKEAQYCKHLVQDCSSDPCQNNQLCVSYGNRYYCNCSTGYEGRVCEYDKNECLDNNGGCSHSCNNTDGSYKCTCPENMVLSEDHLSCKDTSFCEVDGQIFLDGQTWMSSCRECLCDKSSVTCQDLECEDIKCQPEEYMVLLPGQCCPRCVIYSFCFLSPNNTLTNFEYSEMELTDDCAFTLVEDCVHGHFSLRLKSLEKNGTSERNLFIYQSCQNIQLSQAGDLFLNDEAFLPPFRNELFDVKSNNLSTEIRTQSGVYLHWYSNGDIIIAVPAEIADYTCGICGRLQESNVIRSKNVKGSEGSPSVSSYFDVIYSFVLL